MKKTLLFLSAFTLFLTACGGDTSGSEESTSSTATTSSSTSASSESTKDEGELLILKSDCVGCHHEENKLIGPAYKDVAAKYPATDENINYLAGKIIKGGKGVWGTVPMTPHTKNNRRSSEDNGEIHFIAKKITLHFKNSPNG